MKYKIAKETLASSNKALPDDGNCTETCSRFFNVNFNIFLSNSLVHQLVNRKL